MNFIVGGALFCLCTFIGVDISRKYKKKLRFINDFKVLIDYLETNILYLQDTLDKLISDKLDSFANEFKSFMQDFNKNIINSESFLNKWSEEQNILNNDTAELIKNFLLNLGKMDSISQLQNIKQTNELLSSHIENVKKEQKKGYISARLGVMGGLTLFILVI